jgi:hypothetical protein
MYSHFLFKTKTMSCVSFFPFLLSHTKQSVTTFLLSLSHALCMFFNNIYNFNPWPTNSWNNRRLTSLFHSTTLIWETKTNTPIDLISFPSPNHHHHVIFIKLLIQNQHAMVSISSSNPY